MPPKRPSTEGEDTILKQGFLIKSPPPYILSQRASWKGRLFRLSKTLVGSYHIRYYAYDGTMEKSKGEIAVSDIKSIELGSNTMSRIVTITRLFNNSPENILCIKTSERDYYLVDDNVKNIADWQKCITDVWVKINQKGNEEGPHIVHPALVSPPLQSTLARLSRELRDMEIYPVKRRQAAVRHVRSPQSENQAIVMEEVPRPKSYPEERPRTDACLDPQERERSLTDPESRRGHPCPAIEGTELSVEKPSEKMDLAGSASQPRRSRIHSDILPAGNPPKDDFRRLSLEDQFQQKTDVRRLSEDAAYISESEPIYDTPRPVHVNLDLSLESKEEEEEEEEEESSDSDEGVYQEMLSLQQDSFEEEESVSDSAEQPQILAEERFWTQEKKSRFPPEPPQISKTRARRGCPTLEGSRLKKAYILKMIYEQDASDYVKIDLTLPTAHLQKHLDLQEIGERLCVSKWKGPADIGCLFHHGDHIEEINGFRPENKEFFSKLLNCCIKDKVNLVVVRNKTAGIFHVEGCSCGDS